MTTAAVHPFGQASWALPGERRGWRQHTAFALFVLTNVALFLRPAEMLTELGKFPIYELLILSCLALSLPEIAGQVRTRALVVRPMTVCVLGLLAAVILSHLSHLYFGGAAKAGAVFARVVVYYLLVIALIDTPQRVLGMVNCIAWLALLLAAVALLGYFGVITAEAVTPLAQRFSNEWGEDYFVHRLRGPGIFNDPNDLCLIVVPGMALWLHRLDTGRRWGAISMAKAAGGLALFGYALLLTRSRGGFIVLLAAVMTFLLARVGWRRMLPWACLLLPVLFFCFAGRQTSINISDSGDTAQERIRLWSDGLMMLRHSPLFGNGFDTFGDEAGLVAHNSFVHTYAELGLLGGTLFFAMFYLALTGVYQMDRPSDARMARLRPYLMAALGGYTAGMLSLSRPYAVPTYLMLGVAAAYVHCTGAAKLRLSLSLARRIVVASIVLLAATYLFVRATVLWS